MSDEPVKGFESDRAVDSDGVVGARWWNNSLIAADKSASRRGCLKTLVIGAASVAAFKVVCVDSCSGDGYDPDAYTYANIGSLDLQRKYGWEFGAAGEALVFDGTANAPFDPAAIAALEQDLSPRTYAALHVPTLLQSPNATPTERPAEETVAFEPLAGKLRPISTAGMDLVYKRGEALAKLLSEGVAPVAVVADLRGSLSVALAAALADAFEPVLLLDNWPHPQGVVASHMTLAALLYYQPLFVKARAARAPGAMPVFVLDRERLSPYIDASAKFDNRYAARMPSPAALQAATGGELKWVMYVVDAARDLPEQDDLNDMFLAYVAAGVPVRAISLDMFTEVAGGGLGYTGGIGSLKPSGRETFLADYGAAGEVGGIGQGYLSGSTMPERYTPTARTHPSHVIGASDFATTAVVMSASSGALLGSRYDRRGSWNRTGG